MTDRHLLIGGYTQDAPGAGPAPQAGPAPVRRARLAADARLTDAGHLDAGVNPSWIAAHPSLPIAYACTEDFTPGAGGRLVAWNLADPAARPVGAVASGGHAPCHICFAPGDGADWLVVSHYVGGQVSLAPVAADGGLAGEPSDVIVHRGATLAVPDRQEAPHPHQAVWDPHVGLVWVADLGQDLITGYRIEAGKLVAAAQMATPWGFGPRHSALHPGGRHLAVVGELANQVIVYRRGPAGADWRQTDRVSTLPAGWSGQSGAAALIWDPSGRRLYASNRGHDSVAVWTFAAGSGRLSLIGHCPVGAAPRDFDLTPDGRLAVVAAQGEHRAICHPVLESGRLGPAVGWLPCAYPSRVAWLNIRS